MKKILSAILASAMILSAFAVTSFAEEKKIDCVLENAGDANGDNKVNAKDISLLLRFNTGLVTSIQNDLADVNRDGKVNAKDTSLLLKFMAEWSGIFLGHKSIETTVEKSTCTVHGKIKYGCTNCGTEFDSTELALANHHFVNSVCDMCQKNLSELFAAWIGEGRTYTDSDVAELTAKLLEKLQNENDIPNVPEYAFAVKYETGVGDASEFLGTELSDEEMRSILIEFGYDAEDADHDELVSLYEEYLECIEYYREELENGGIDTSGMTNSEIEAAFWNWQEQKFIEHYREALEEAGIDTTGMDDETVTEEYWKLLEREQLEHYKQILEEAGIDYSGMSDDEIIEAGQLQEMKSEADGYRKAFTEAGLDVSAYSDEELIEMSFYLHTILEFKNYADGLGLDTSKLSTEDLIAYYEQFDHIQSMALSRMTLRQNGVDCSGMTDEEIIEAVNNLEPGVVETKYEIKTVDTNPYKFSFGMTNGTMALSLVFSDVSASAEPEMELYWYFVGSVPTADDYDTEGADDFIKAIVQATVDKSCYVAVATIDTAKLEAFFNSENNSAAMNMDFVKDRSFYDAKGEPAVTQYSEEELTMLDMLMGVTAYGCAGILEVIMNADGAQISLTDFGLNVGNLIDIPA